MSLSEYSIPGYDLFVNKSPKAGLLCILATKQNKKLNALECEELNKTDFEESVWCYFTNSNNQRVLAGGIII